HEAVVFLGVRDKGERVRRAASFLDHSARHQFVPLLKDPANDAMRSGFGAVDHGQRRSRIGVGHTRDGCPLWAVKATTFHPDCRNSVAIASWRSNALTPVSIVSTPRWSDPSGVSENV